MEQRGQIAHVRSIRVAGPDGNSLGLCQFRFPVTTALWPKVAQLVVAMLLVGGWGQEFNIAWTRIALIPILMIVLPSLWTFSNERTRHQDMNHFVTHFLESRIPESNARVIDLASAKLRFQNPVANMSDSSLRARFIAWIAWYRSPFFHASIVTHSNQGLV